LSLSVNCEGKTDSEVVELAKENPDYLACLMERYEEKLFYYIRRISYFSKEDIEDILQEVFIKVYKNLNDYEDSLKFSSWIYRITHNHTVDEIRKRGGKKTAISLDKDDLFKFIKSGVNLEKDVATREKMRKVRETMEQMPLKYREPLILRFLEEKSYDEIMDILKKPKGTVATLIKRGKKMFLSQIDPRIHSL
jgi:RNA polymerase sigma-70 factor (ECF subfamily)